MIRMENLDVLSVRSRLCLRHKLLNVQWCAYGSPKALQKDQSMSMAIHHEFVMKEEDEDLIDITERINLTGIHTSLQTLLPWKLRSNIGLANFRI